MRQLAIVVSVGACVGHVARYTGRTLVASLDFDRRMSHSTSELTQPSYTGAPTRRDLLGSFTTLAMFAGLAGGYGTFFAMAGQFLFPARRERVWWFVASASRVAPGESIAFVSPAGVPVVIKRSLQAVENGAAPTVDDFVALSSTCPHLGCRVNWEGQHNRFFCPCHNGSFDPEGRPTGGPPLAAQQHLPRYPLRIDNGLLYIEMPASSIGRGPQEERA